MRISELMRELQAMADEHGDDVEVRLAVQPNWPFEHSISSVVATQAVEVGDLDEDGEKAGAEDVKPAVVYIGEGGQLGYLPGQATSELGW